MLSFFRRKAPSSTPAELTFNERADAFWKWYAEVAPRFFTTIEEGRCADLAGEVSAKVDELLPGFAWVFGPGADGVGHSFTLSGEGVVHKQILSLHWLSRAPKLAGWTFYAARQPGPTKGIGLVIGGIKFSSNEIWVTPTLDREAELFHLTLWHPAWERLEDREKFQVTFLFLDEALGECGTGWWIGRIEFNKDKLAASFPLEELAGHIRGASEAEGWKKYPPGESSSLLRFKEIEAVFPRSDTFSQVTAVPELIQDFFEKRGNLENPLKDTGADYLYVSLPNDILPRGGEVAKRGEFEDALDEALNKEGRGRCLGGAIGSERVYVDLLICDGPRSLETIQRVLKSLNAPKGTMIEHFAREKLGRRIAL